MKYDVFISKNTKDAKNTSILLSFLERAGLNVFESEKSLPRLGMADYAQAIDEALEQSENLIVLCSPNELGTGTGNSSRWFIMNGHLLETSCSQREKMVI